MTLPLPRRGLLPLAGLLAMPALGRAAGAVTVRDVVGREVTLPAPARRLLLGEGRFIQLLALLERQDPAGLVAAWMGEFQRTDPQGHAQFVARFPAAARIPVVGASAAETFSIERALDARPDLAILGLDGHGPGKAAEAVAQLERAGVPVVFIDFRQEPLENSARSIGLVGRLIGREAQAREYLDFVQGRMDRIRAALAAANPAQPAVLMEMRAGGGRECCGSPGRGNLGEFIAFAGGRNIGADIIPGALGQLNTEYVVAQQPAVYVATGGTGGGADGAPKLGAGVTEAEARAALRGTVARTGIAGLPAVREGRAHGLWHSFYNSPLNILALEAMARWFHPQIFADLDPGATLAAINARFLAVPLDGTYWVSLR
ncbi:ABC transporter substrate-binding protein [Roseomonas sp. OT10]|uniref:ABC transporter substrate-binding protein n=1 Tax=Roseomonas cutis TaxID=2897332 RepID=UPI001E4A3374|nr:ABC transporter substrate-binding protein [Roseomonas sp. OT10]UFN49801.1 ABC transporter substrate-binding protein [Roseomonas sp. OT10]